IPPVSIRDMVIHPRERDLILGTHGRGVMIIDDLTPLRALNEDIIQKELAFLPSKPYVITPTIRSQNFPGDDEFSGTNPNSNAVVTYYLKKRHIFGDLFLEVYDKEGNLIKKVPSGKRKGINRVYWNTRKKPPRIPRGKGLAFQAAFGPSLAPGNYTVKLTKGEEVYETEVELVFDPRSPHSKSDLQANFEATTRSYELLEELAETVAHIQALEEQAGERIEKLKTSKFKESISSFKDDLNMLRKTLVATRSGGITGEVRLREKLSEVYGGISGYSGKPTQSQVDALEDIAVEIKAAITAFGSQLEKLPKINKGLKKRKLDELTYVPEKEEE
ncbi:MAG: glycosyl hydrolase, partial [Bacteroidota bacterium]